MKTVRAKCTLCQSPGAHDLLRPGTARCGWCGGVFRLHKH